MAESISEGTLKSWLKKPGEFVNADEEVATIETDKVRYSTRYPSLLLSRRSTSSRTSRLSTINVGWLSFDTGRTHRILILCGLHRTAMSCS